MCGATRTDRTGTPFAGYFWAREMIVTAVRWYGRFRLSLRDVCDLLTGRDVAVSPHTVLSWVHTFGLWDGETPAGYAAAASYTWCSPPRTGRD